ncbi:MAG: transposase [Fibrobacteres bacterium]|nr:transposase [Fibrobacterota bacterium]
MRKIKEICDKALQGLNSEFDQAYKVGGRPSIPPEQLLKGSLLQIIYGIRSERQLCERIDDSLTFRWFLDLPLDQEAWVPTVYTHNRDRLLSTEMSRNFLARVVEFGKGFVSTCQVVDGTPHSGLGSTKKPQPMASDSDDDTPTAPPPSEPSSEPSTDDAKPHTGKDILRDFRGETFSNSTHRSSRPGFSPCSKEQQYSRQAQLLGQRDDGKSQWIGG